MTTQFFFITELNGMCYFKLLLSVINNNLLIMIKNSKKNKNRERIHEKMGQGRIAAWMSKHATDEENAHGLFWVKWIG